MKREEDGLCKLEEQTDSGRPKGCTTRHYSKEIILLEKHARNQANLLVVVGCHGWSFIQGFYLLLNTANEKS